MTWFRLDHSFSRHPKLLALTASERWVWIDTLCWATQYAEASGIISPAADYAIPGLKKLRAKLRAVALLDERDGQDEVHNWYLYTSASIGEKVKWYMERNPGATANEVVRRVGGTRHMVLEEVKKLNPVAPEGGSTEPEDGGSTEPAKVVRKVVHARTRHVTSHSSSSNEDSAPPSSAADEKDAVRDAEMGRVRSAIEEVWGKLPSPSSKGERGKRTSAVAQLHPLLTAFNADPDTWVDELRRRANILLARWQDRSKVTPLAVAGNWHDAGGAVGFSAPTRDLPSWVASASPDLRAVLERYPDRVWACEPVWWEREVEGGLGVDRLEWLLTREG